MRFLRIVTLFSSMLFMLTLSQAEAKWWIFGQSSEEITTRYLYLNNMSYDEGGDKVVLYREMLPLGQITIRGKSGTVKGSVGAVQVSTNGKESWNKAKLAQDGTFEYTFKPEVRKPYTIYVKIVDTTGKTNDFEATRKEVIVSDQNVQRVVADLLGRMVETYQNEDAPRFMALISSDFTGDAVVLDRAIRKDFTAFDQLSLRYTLNNVATDPQGKIFVSFTFSRFVTSTRSGKSFSDKGTTEFILKLTETGPLVYSMKHPLIFGLSEAEDVGQGVVNQGNNDQFIAIVNYGDVGKLSLGQIVSGEGINTGTATITESPYRSFTFADGSVNLETGTPPTITNGDIGYFSGLMQMRSGLSAATAGPVSIDSVTASSAAGLSYSSAAFHAFPGYCFVIQLGPNLYGVIETVSTGTGSITFKYKVVGGAALGP